MMGLLNLETYAPQVGLLNDEQRKQAASLAWLNAAGKLFDASAPQAGGMQKTPLQMLGAGMTGYMQGAGDYADTAIQSNVLKTKLDAEKQQKQWAERVSPQLGQYGLPQELAAGMQPNDMQKFIAEAIADNRKAETQKDLYGMMTDRTLAGQAAIAERQQRAQDAALQRMREEKDLDYTRSLALAEAEAKRRSDAMLAKPLPTTALKLQDEALGDIATASAIQKDLTTFENQINNKDLDLGMLSNIVNKGMNATGLSSKESRNLATFESSLQKLRNDSLRLNKGVQTEGDAVRAWDELVANINDKDLVKERLAEIKAINKRAATIKKSQVEQLRDEYGKDQIDFSKYENVESAIGVGSDGINVDAPSGQIKFMGFEE